MSHNKNLLTLISVSLLAAKFSEASTTPTYVPGPSSGKISGAPGQVLPATPPSVDLSSTNAPSTNYNPANDNPGLYSGLPMEMPEGLTQAPEAFWKRDTLFGDPYGIRNKISNYGFEFSPVYTGEIFGNASGGIKQGVAYDHSLNLPLTIYMDKLANWWEGGTMHANAMWIAGHSLSADKVGDISGVSNIAGDPALRLQELWYQQTFWSMRASVKVGVLAADAEFFTSDTASLFINGTFGAFTLVGANLPDPAVYPMAAPGARFLIQPIPQFYFQAGVYDGTTEDQDVNKSGVNFHVSRGDGALIFSEIGWLVNQAPTERGLIGTYKLGSFVHTGDFQDNITGEDKGANFGVYGVADQELYKRGGKVISAFVRGGGGPADLNTVDWYFDAGFNFSGFIPGRLLDTAGIAVARSNFSSDFSDAQVSGGSNGFSQETVIEATYKVQVSPWWTVQPDFQYIFNPSGEKGSHDAAIIGVRTSVVF